MTDSKPNEPGDADDPRIEQALRLGELRAKVDEATGGAFVEHVDEATPMDMQEQFWENVLAYETAPEGTLQAALQKHGFTPKAVDALETDEAVHAALWQLLRALAELRVFLNFSNHLSDRELYMMLVNEALPEERVIMPPASGWSCRFDMSEFTTPEFPEPYDAYMAYYADEEYRKRSLENFPSIPLPPCRKPLYERDRLLPGSSEATNNWPMAPDM